MKLIVAMRQLPDLVEELELDSSGKDIDREYLTFVSNEWDEQALEEALLLKEATGAEVCVVALDEPDVDSTLYTALAKGADRAVKLTGIPEGWMSTHDRAAILSAWLAEQSYDLIMTGVQAADDLDGQLAAIVAARLGLPHAAVVVRVDAEDGVAVVSQELGGGTAVEAEIRLPAVLGVQTARQPPRYAPITRIRQAMNAGGLEEAPAAVTPGVRPGLRRLFPPQRSGQAEMLEGAPADVAERIIDILRSKGLIDAGA